MDQGGPTAIYGVHGKLYIAINTQTTGRCGIRLIVGRRSTDRRVIAGLLQRSLA